jgi:valyl-tRNA synthetase
VDAATLAKPGIEAVQDGRIKFVPKQWENTYFEWMRNIQPWCVSRQIWWGHQIPAWYGPDGAVFVEYSEEAAGKAAEAHYGDAVELTRDEDVLDTWFSSALWPFSTLGWPDETPELARYYPGDVLVTGFDIIFFWVARMIMMGLHFMGEVPYRTVYIHALVRDQHGQKMSKSKRNIIDPLELIDKYGCDALRFTLAALLAPGRDVKLSESRVEGYRNFSTKLWNAARYGLMNGAALEDDFDPAACTQTINRWIVGKVAATGQTLSDAIEAYRFDEAANILYHFTWDEFCDWYLEFTKPILAGDDEAAARETRATMGWALGRLLHLLHPLMPFITEELWEHLGGRERGRLITSAWPEDAPALIDTAAQAEIDWVIRLISEVRGVRAEMHVPARAEIPLLLKDAGEASRRRLEAYRDIVARQARLGSIELTDGAVPKGAVQIVLDEATAILPLADVIDVSKELKRLEREIDKAASEIGKLDRKLANADFLAKAPPEVVEEQRERRAEATQLRDRLASALERLAG